MLRVVPYPKNSGKSVKHLKQKWGHSFFYFKKKRSLESGEWMNGLRSEGSDWIQIDLLWDFCNCAERRKMVVWAKMADADMMRSRTMWRKILVVKK